MDRFRCLEAFVAVAETRSFANAARRLGASTSSVSDRVAQPEGLVGAALFSRTTRSVVPTEQGTALYDAYAPVLAEMSRLDGRADVNAVSGRLRIGCVVDVGLHEGAEAVARLAAAHPGLACELVLGDGPANPLGAGFDVTLHYRRVTAPGVVQVEMGMMRCGLFASPDLAGEVGPLHGPTDIAGLACVGYGYQGGVEEWDASDWPFRRRRPDGQEDVTVRVPLVARMNSSTVLRVLLERGRGVGVLPLARARDAVEAGRLVRLLPDWQPPPLRLLATLPKGMEGSTRARAFLQAVQDQLAAADT